MNRFKTKGYAVLCPGGAKRAAPPQARAAEGHSYWKESGRANADGAGCRLHRKRMAGALLKKARAAAPDAGKSRGPFTEKQACFLRKRQNAIDLLMVCTVPDQL